MTLHKNGKAIFGNARFDVEHAISLHASSFCTIPALALYDKDNLAPMMDVINSCHIYLIGLLPLISVKSAKLIDSNLVLDVYLHGKSYQIEHPIESQYSLVEEDDDFYLDCGDGNKYWPDQNLLIWLLNQKYGVINFEVKYIGQAYGNEGSRNAVDRLLKHETLQRIAVQGIPDGYVLSLLLLEVHPDTTMITVFNPHAKDNSDSASRITAGIDKLFGTSEQEQIALYEASLIRYFSPEFNKEFKNSFPSTNLKILQDCYEKDFTAVIAEITIDELPFWLTSDSVSPSQTHLVVHNLHEKEDRNAFFYV